jgi:hypothetical protein
MKRLAKILLLPAAMMIATVGFAQTQTNTGTGGVPSTPSTNGTSPAPQRQTTAAPAMNNTQPGQTAGSRFNTPYQSQAQKTQDSIRRAERKANRQARKQSKKAEKQAKKAEKTQQKRTKDSTASYGSPGH